MLPDLHVTYCTDLYWRSWDVCGEMFITWVCDVLVNVFGAFGLAFVVYVCSWILFPSFQFLRSLLSDLCRLRGVKCPLVLAGCWMWEIPTNLQVQKQGLSRWTHSTTLDSWIFLVKILHIECETYIVYTYGFSQPIAIYLVYHLI